ncbi:uncharacterized protein LOC123266096 [Cotesia glomerata]|uniref:uncharacterized protein LOC123266096 n=1 Tax=Cotesia glomerata TaxID=32391 RepID=UPI001D028D04|nr:uncharacterized protein LOC123266096 [Cotesia glomerata]
METRGQRQGSNRIVHDGFTFHLDSRYSTKVRKRYLCSSRITVNRCRVKLWKNADGRLQVDGIHNHLIPEILNREPVIRELQNNALLTDLFPNEIINNVSRNLPNAGNIRSHASRQVIHRQRRRHRPPLPQNFVHLGPMLTAYRRISNIYQQEVIADDGSIAQIFGSNNMLKRLGESNEWHIDGTFQCVPLRPRASQLLIIHVRRMDVGIPILYVLCSRRTTKMYESIFRWILFEVPVIQQNLQTVVTDFEAAILKSIQSCMPWVHRRGCWFHFARAVTRKWNSLRLPDRNAPEHRILNLTWVLPLVPAARLEEALEEIVTLLRPLEENNDNFYLFRRYLQRFWLPLADIISVYNTPWRTNNISEVYNLHLSSILGPHPPLFKFLHRLIEIIKDDEKKLNRLLGGMDFGRNRRHRQYHMDLFIQGIQEALETRRYSMLEFLEMAAIRRVEVRYRLDVAVMRQQYVDDDLKMEEEVLLGHIRDVELPAAIQAPIDAANPIDDINHYAGEIIMENQQEVAPWIHAATAGMIFPDQPAIEGAQCYACLVNQAKAVFCPCGHLCLCLELS